MQQQPTGHFIVGQNILMSYIEELCEIALSIPLTLSGEEKINKPAFTSSITTVEINKNDRFVLIVNCDDSLLDAVFEKKLSGMEIINIKKYNSNIIDELAYSISFGISNVFANDPRFGFPVPPQSSADGIILQTFLKHASGHIHIVFKELEQSPLSEIEF